MSIGIQLQLQLQLEVGDVTNEKTDFATLLLPRNSDSRLASLGTLNPYNHEKGEMDPD